MASQAEAVGDTEVWNRQTEQLELKLGVQQGTGVGTALQQALMRHPGRGSCPGGPAAEKRRGRAAPAPAPEGSARRPSRDVPPPRALPGTARPPHRSFPQENLPPTSYLPPRLPEPSPGRRGGARSGRLSKGHRTRWRRRRRTCRRPPGPEPRGERAGPGKGRPQRGRGRAHTTLPAVQCAAPRCNALQRTAQRACEYPAKHTRALSASPAPHA